MHQPYTAPTSNSERPASGIHTSPRQSSHPQTNPPTTQSTKSPRSSSHKNQSTNDHRRTNQTTDTTLHKYHTHTASTNTHGPTNTHAHSTQARPPTQTLTPSHREAMPYPDVDAAPMQSQPRCSRSLRNRTGQVSDRIRPTTRPGSGQDIDTAFDRDQEAGLRIHN